jgi:hypothetical protein
LAIDPSESEAVAVSGTDAGAANVPPLAGAVSDTVGTVFEAGGTLLVSLKVSSTAVVVAAVL